jgi:rod shape-determining protein MreC
METSSRDDFVIAIRSAFLKKGNQQRFSLVGLIIFSIAIVILGRFNIKPINYLKITLNEIVYQSTLIVSLPENYFKKIYMNINSHFSFYNDYSNIKEKLEKLQEQSNVDKYIISENERLKKIIDDYIVVSQEVIAKVLIDKQSPFLKTIIINKGSKNDIKLGMIVLDGEYLIGKVVEVNFLTSRVLLLSDLNSKIPVVIEPGGYQSILSGTGKNHGIIQYSKNQYIGEEKNIIYTSGSGGLFKAGIPIGKIEKDQIKANNIITFFSDFSQLKFVKILSFKKGTN